MLTTALTCIFKVKFRPHAGPQSEAKITIHQLSTKPSRALNLKILLSTRLKVNKMPKEPSRAALKFAAPTGNLHAKLLQNSAGVCGAIKMLKLLSGFFFCTLWVTQPY